MSTINKDTQIIMNGSNMTVLPTNFPDVEILYINDCKFLTAIPTLSSLRELYCSGDVSITKIAHQPKLLKLVCKGCTAITMLPQFPSITHLDCRKCTNLFQLPPLPSGVELINDPHTQLHHTNSFTIAPSPKKIAPMPELFP